MLSKHLATIVLAFSTGAVLSYAGFKNFLLFHTVLELAAIVVTVSVFLLTWNARKVINNKFFIYLGLGFGFVGMFDLTHLLTYRGMQIFPNISANIPTQLWLISRYLFAGLLLLSPLFHRLKIRARHVLLGLSVFSLVMLFSVFEWQIFPAAYNEGIGLTTFKIFSEYVIIGLFAWAGINLYRKRQSFDREVLTLLILSFGYNMGSELLFTMYFSPFDFFNMAGHILKIIAYGYIYRALIGIGLTQPYSLLFRELHQANSLKEEFIDIAGHELKTPLTSMKVYVQLLEKRLETAADKKSLAMVRRTAMQINRMNRLVTELLDAGKIQSGRMVFRKKTFNFKKELSLLVEEFSQTAENHTVSLVGKVPVRFYGDKERLNQAIGNLIGNAIKYSPRGKKVVVEAGRQDSVITLKIQDFGIGIEKHKIPYIFDKYYRGEKDGEKTDGLGIGLYVTWKIIKAHQGKIKVDSSPGKGTTFTVTLPYKLVKASRVIV